MTLRQNLNVQMKQSLAMTPGLIQAIQLLKFNQEELETFLREQEEKNPLIDIVGGQFGSSAEPQVETESQQSLLEAVQPEERIPSANATQKSSASTSGSAAEYSVFEDMRAAQVTLREHLLMQASLKFKDSLDLIAATDLIDAMNSDGYLNANDIDWVADDREMSLERVESILAQIQTFSPSGVGARNLAECLAIQLREKSLLTPQMKILLANLELVAKLKFEELGRLCGTSRKTIMSMVQVIRSLNPHPGDEFDAVEALPVIPDLIVRIDERSGDISVELNTDILPRVLVNEQYYSRISAEVGEGEETRFVTSCLQNANWLVRNLEQRANTMLKVATEIVRQQREFFAEGSCTLKPLRQRDVADVLGMHRSTVCRATAGKFIMTNRGTYDMSYFFSNAIGSTDGEDDHSAEAIRTHIRALIAAETPKNIYSDDALVGLLKQLGVDIARRTVAKYREMLNIPSSQIRKRQMRIEQSAPQRLSA